MSVFVNGKEIVISTGKNTILSLIESYELNPKLVIVERNKEIIEKDNYKSTILKQGDHIEIVHFVGGG
ncbi:sulfur carrier protein ThiS [Robertmurraya korlensis]|uniref:sulfur carrier protein ThiS n=1 Tax=Robertmurraya korlensis TaxID=519977 RepID=UPI0008271DB7|nr:sulfur carrier protein ThiS [Robertmurraya korlensis]